MKSRDNESESVPPKKVWTARNLSNEIEILGIFGEAELNLNFDANHPSEVNVSSSFVERRRNRPQKKAVKTTPYSVTGKPRGRGGRGRPGLIGARTKRRMNAAKAREKLSEMLEEKTENGVGIIQAKRALTRQNSRRL